MAAQNTDKFKKLSPKWVGNIGAAGVANGTVETIPLTSASNLATDTAVVATINRVDANGVKTTGGVDETIIGVVSGNNLINCVRGVEGTAQAHTAGQVVEILVTAKGLNDIIDGILVEHGQDGKHTDATVTTLKATGAEINTGTEDAKIVTPKAIADSTLVFTNSLAYQCIINGSFTVNQRGYVSNATLAAGVYGHDRWKAGASGGDYTFTQLAQATQITIKTGKSLIQVIEDKNVIGGTYTLSWTGTAQARFGKDSATPSGSYSASPVTITGQSAGTVMSIEFNEGTVGQVNLANLSLPLPFMPKSYDEELRACKRYFERLTSSEALSIYGTGVLINVINSNIQIKFEVEKRIIPTLTFSGTVGDFTLRSADSQAASSISQITGATSKNASNVSVVPASDMTAGQAVLLRNTSTNTTYIDISAEL